MLPDWLPRADSATPPSDAAVLEMALPPTPASAGDARRALAGYCSRNAVPVSLADTAALATSELVTNALLHARTPILVLAEYGDGILTLAVRDGEAVLPTLLPPTRSGKATGALRSSIGWPRSGASSKPGSARWCG
jgi:hypothetical protein